MVEAVGVRGAGPDVIEHGAMGEAADCVQGKAEIGLWKSCEQTLPQHRHGARTDFFGRLGNEHQRAAPLVFQANQRPGRSHPARHVNVVAATVGHECFTSLPGGLVAARIGKAGLLFHRQRIEFGAHHDGGAIAILVDRNQSGLADAAPSPRSPGPAFRQPIWLPSSPPEKRVRGGRGCPCRARRVLDSRSRSTSRWRSSG